MYNAPVSYYGRLLRLTALILVCVLTLTLAAPARAEAEVMTALAIAGAAVVVLIIVVFLVVANVRGSTMGSEHVPVMWACAEVEGQPQACWPLPQGSRTAEMADSLESAPGLLTPEPAPQS